MQFEGTSVQECNPDMTKQTQQMIDKANQLARDQMAGIKEQGPYNTTGNITGGWPYNQPTPKVCPACGVCPTCGKSGYQYPYQWTYINGSPTLKSYM